MSNKAVSAYFEAMKRKDEEQEKGEKKLLTSEAKENAKKVSNSTSVETDRPTKRQVSKPTGRHSPRGKISHSGVDLYPDQRKMLTRIQFALWRRDDVKL